MSARCSYSQRSTTLSVASCTPYTFTIVPCLFAIAYYCYRLLLYPTTTTVTTASFVTATQLLLQMLLLLLFISVVEEYRIHKAKQHTICEFEWDFQLLDVNPYYSCERTCKHVVVDVDIDLCLCYERESLFPPSTLTTTLDSIVWNIHTLPVRLRFKIFKFSFNGLWQHNGKVWTCVLPGGCV